jgi:hypothetical protein
MLAEDTLGPSYRGAFGLVAFVHLRDYIEDNQRVLEDDGIRTHGTGHLTSLSYGASHGCHRVLGRNMVRLAGFVLAHRQHIHRGNQPAYYRRVLHHRGERFPIAIDSLGYRIDVVPPIWVEVLPER